MTPTHPLFETLQQLADLADIRGEDHLAADYRAAVTALEPRGPAETARVWQLALSDRLDREPLAPAIRTRLRDLARAGAPATLRTSAARLPQLLGTLIERSILTIPEALLLARHCNVLTLDDLAAALGEGRLRQGPAAALEPRLAGVLPTLQAESRPITLGRSVDVAETLAERMTTAVPAISDVTVAGDIRRAEPMVSAIVLVGRASDPPSAIDAVSTLGGIGDVRYRGPRRAIVSVQQTEVDIQIAAPDDYGTVLFAATGTRAHIDAVRRRSGRHRLAAREEDVYAQAGLPFIPPELRRGAGDVAAAAAGPLLPLVSIEHMRGDLHMHTDWSDGRDPLDAMLAACHALGYEYVAITDHSESAAASRTVSRDALMRQADAIAALRLRYPSMAILHGIEIEILHDGRLDWDDRLLERLDLVLASLHDAAGQDGPALTRRCLQAMRHPLVNVITHPANRLVGRFDGYDLDFDAIYEAARETGTALEIDGAPSHLDLDGDRARDAVAAGATVTIDSDCHRAAALGRQMRLGVATARRGWVRAEQVLNTRPLNEVKAFIAAKRQKS